LDNYAGPAKIDWQRMMWGLLRSMIPAFVSPSVTRLGSANTAERLEILLEVENFGEPGTLLDERLFFLLRKLL